MKCPICGGRNTGLVGYRQYYCSDCYKEYRIYKKSIEVFQIEDDGTLTRKEVMSLAGSVK